jgi:hypothetical protein
MANQPAPEDAARITGIVRKYKQWSVAWGPKYHLWRAAEDDADSGLYPSWASADLSPVDAVKRRGGRAGDLRR